MAEFNITGWLDPALKYFADQAGIPVSDYSAQVGGEGIGVALECIADLFTKGWLNKAIQFVTGLIASGYAIFGRDVNIRLRKELLALGTHELLRIVNPKPSEILEIRDSLSRFIDAAARGDWEGALSSVLRTTGELQAMLGITSPPPAPSTSFPGLGSMPAFVPVPVVATATARAAPVEKIY